MKTYLELTQKAVGKAPCSTRALAKASGLSPALLSRILSGERGLTAPVAKALAAGLRGWAKNCIEAARDLERLANQTARRD